jgi:hypothetical protein
MPNGGTDVPCKQTDRPGKQADRAERQTEASEILVKRPCKPLNNDSI